MYKFYKELEMIEPYTKEDIIDWAATLLVRYASYSVKQALELCKFEIATYDIINFYEQQEGHDYWAII